MSKKYSNPLNDYISASKSDVSADIDWTVRAYAGFAWPTSRQSNWGHSVDELRVEPDEQHGGPQLILASQCSLVGSPLRS